MELHSTGASFIADKNENNPRDLVAEAIKKLPDGTRKEQFDHFRQELARSDDEIRRAVDWYFFVNMHDYMTTSSRNRRPDPLERTKQRERQAAIVESIKAQIVLLDLLMPNGKAMRDCTGAEMAKFGNRYQKIAERVGRTKLVGAVLDEKQVKSILS